MYGGLDQTENYLEVKMFASNIQTNIQYKFTMYGGLDQTENYLEVSDLVLTFLFCFSCSLRALHGVQFFS